MRPALTVRTFENTSTGVLRSAVERRHQEQQTDTTTQQPNTA
jgi:hypothetical protein